MPTHAPVIWLTGLSSAGKSTIAAIVVRHLQHEGVPVEWLDGDEMRRQLGRDLGFSPEDRGENIRRIALVAGLLSKHNVTAVVSAIAPYQAMRDALRRMLPGYLEVFVNAPLAVCESRDIKGLYRRFRAGELRAMTGLDDPYEPPPHPEVTCHTQFETPAVSAAKVLRAINSKSLTGPERALSAGT